MSLWLFFKRKPAIQ